MTRRRVIGIVFHTVLSLLVLTLLWVAVGMPLPWKWEYRRIERAMLLEPMEILYHGEENEVLSADEEKLGFFTGDSWGLPMYHNHLYLFPLENGVGRAMRKQTFFGLDVWAYDASGNSVRADLELTLWTSEHEPVTTRKSAEKEDGLFTFYVDENENLEDAMEAMVALEIGKNVDEETEAGYQLNLIFYDEAGNVTATHESGGTCNEDR